MAKAISRHYNLFYLDTGKIYRFIAYLKIKFPKNFNNKFIKSKIKSFIQKIVKHNKSRNVDFFEKQARKYLKMRKIGWKKLEPAIIPT